MEKENNSNKLNFQFHPDKGREKDAHKLLSTFEGVELTEGIDAASLVKIENGERPALYGVCPEDKKDEIVEKLSRDKIAAFSLSTTFSSWRAGVEVDLHELSTRD